MDSRSSSAMFKRAEQLKRWQESDTNKQSSVPRHAAKIYFSTSTVFLAACKAGDKEEIQRLLKMGADINTPNVDGLTALHQACIDDNMDMVEFLVSHGADVNQRDNEGWTPLHATASCGFDSIARFLIENGSDVAAVNFDGELPIDIAEIPEGMKMILKKAIDEKGIDCEKSRNAESTALLTDARQWAVNGYQEIRDPKTGGTPLHVAAAKGYTEVARTLLEDCKLDPNCVDDEGWTPLHAAVLWGQKAVATVLLRYGADPNIKNYSGQTCFDIVDPKISMWLKDAVLILRPKDINNSGSSLSRTRSNSFKRTLSRSDTQQPAQGQKSAFVNGEKFRKSSDNDVTLRRTHSFENDKSINQKKVNQPKAAISTSTGSSAVGPRDPKQDALGAIRSSAESVESNDSDSTPSSTTPTKLSPGNVFKNFFKSFVLPVRDDESETQRKAHAKRVRETRRSTQGVTLEEIKSAEQLIKGNTNATSTSSTSTATSTTTSTSRGATAGGDVAVACSVALACASATASSTAAATIAAHSEHRPSWRLRFDPGHKEATVSSPQPSTSAVVPQAEAEATVTLCQPQTSSTVTASNQENSAGSEELNNENDSPEKLLVGNDLGNVTVASPATQAAVNVIQRRRRSKRRSTGVGQIEVEDPANDRGASGDASEPPNVETNTTEQRTEENDSYYKKLYEATVIENKRLQQQINSYELRLKNADLTITQLQENAKSVYLGEKREKRATERKLSEMEEELKTLHLLQVETQRLRDENSALIRVISKLSK